MIHVVFVMPLTTTVIDDYKKVKKQHFGMVHIQFRRIEIVFWDSKKVGLEPRLTITTKRKH